MTFILTTKTELYKIFSRPRTYIAYAAILIIILAIQFAIYADGQKLLDFTTQNLRESFDFSGNLLNGYFISYLILNALWVHIPLLVALVVVIYSPEKPTWARSDLYSQNRLVELHYAPLSLLRPYYTVPVLLFCLAYLALR